jgi:enoyl-CoA hydratase/carnithine racemase
VSTAAGDVLVEAEDGIVTITFNRPAKRNAMTSAMYAGIADALETANTDGTAVVVFTGAGGAFTAGNDLRDMMENPPLGDNPPPVRFLTALNELRAVVVAAVDGPAVGVGTTLLGHCDLVYATATATFRLPFVNLGLVPEAASTLLLPRLVGHQRASELMLFGEPFDAEAALAMGLVTAVVADADELAAVVAERTAALRDKPREALFATKALLRDETATTVPARLKLDSGVLQRLIADLSPPAAR